MSDQPMGRVSVVREFPVQIAEGDGRTLETLIVPYNKPTRVMDAGSPHPYEESWLPGCFAKQTDAANRVKVLVNFEHESGLRGVVGHGIQLVDRADALYGTFRIHNNPDGDKVLSLVEEGIVEGVSLEAVVLRSRRTVAGVVERVRAHLDNVALCRMPAFSDARVLAVRDGDPDDEDGDPDRIGETDPEPDGQPAEPQVPPVPDEEKNGVSETVTERLKQLGFETIVHRAVVRSPWDGSAARFQDDEYQRSCLVCRPGDEPVKTRCSLPVLEPNGDLNVNGMHAAAARLSQTGLTPEQRAKAARKLVRYYRQASETPPDALMNTASRP